MGSVQGTLRKDYFLQVTTPLFIVMYILMGVAPLAWGGAFPPPPGAAARSRADRPAGTDGARAAAYLLGAHTAGSLLQFGYGIVILAGFVALHEIYRGAVARTHTTKESLPRAIVSIFGRNRRRYGGFIVHLGITVIGIGVIGSTLFQQETQQTMSVGQSVTLGQYTMTYDGMLPGQIADDGRVMDIAQLTVQDGNGITQIRPRHDWYPQSEA
ncbi:MAG: cytochrome c-type biogenesis CcmF C-terminal domain-containing protein [Anaerolineae bacterium]